MWLHFKLWFSSNTIHMQHQMPIDKKKIHTWRTRKMWSREILFIHCKCKQNFQVAFASYTRWGGGKLNNQQTKFGSFTYLFLFFKFLDLLFHPHFFFFLNPFHLNSCACILSVFSLKHKHICDLWLKVKQWKVSALNNIRLNTILRKSDIFLLWFGS